MTTEERTNETMIRDLVDNLAPLSLAILRERIVKIAELTKQAIEDNPTAYDNPIYDHTYYLHVCDEIFKYCGFEKHTKNK